MPPGKRKSTAAKARYDPVAKKYATLDVVAESRAILEVEVDGEAEELEEECVFDDLKASTRESILQWSKGADKLLSYRSIFYHGDSERSERRKRQRQGELAAAAKGLPKIDTFFTVESVKRARIEDDPDEVVEIIELLSDDEEEQEQRMHFHVERDLLMERADQLNNLGKFHNNKKTESSHIKQTNGNTLTYTLYQAWAVWHYFTALLAGGKKMASSEKAAALVFHEGKGMQHKAKLIRKWAVEYYVDQEFAEIQRGKHPKIASLIADEEVQQMLVAHLRKMPKHLRTPKQFSEELNNTLLAQIRADLYPDAWMSICEDTARRWMHFLGFSCHAARKSYYTDGHERKDVVKYRVVFLGDMEKEEPYMTEYAGDDMSVVIPPIATDKPERVWLYHDESTFYANEGTRLIWQDELKELLPKTNGPSLMVSAFLCPCHGLMRDQER